MEKACSFVFWFRLRNYVPGYGAYDFLIISDSSSVSSSMSSIYFCFSSKGKRVVSFSGYTGFSPVPKKVCFWCPFSQRIGHFFPRRDREDLGRYSCLLQELLFFPTWVCTNSKVFSIFSILFCEHLRGLMEKRTAKICQLPLLVWPPATPHGLSTLGLYWFVN